MTFSPQSDAREPLQVSVVMVTYNHEQFIEQAIESVASQRVKFGYELIISEDYSTDRTREVIEDSKAKHPDLIRTLYSPENLNTNEVMTRAIAAAKGKYLAFLDGDDYWTDPEKLQRQVNRMERKPQLAMTYHNASHVGQDGEDLGKLHIRPETFEVYDLRSMLTCNPIPGASPMIRREALAKLPPWFDDFGVGDWPLYVIAALSGEIEYIDRVMCVYRIHPDGYWQRMRPKEKTANTLRLMEHFAEVLPRKYARHIRAWKRYWERYPWW